MPEINDPMGAPPHKTRTINHVGLARQNRIKQERIFLRVIFQVRILHDNDVARGGAKSSAERGTFALVGFVIENDIHGSAQLIFDDGSGPIRRTVINENNLQRRNRRAPDGVHDLRNGFALVKTGYDNRNFH